MRLENYRSILSAVPKKIENIRAVFHVGIDVLIWAAIVDLRIVNREWLSTAGIAVLFAVFCFRSFGMMHDCVHRATSTNRLINDYLGEIYGVFCFLPFKGWRALHLDHHAWTGNVEKDPSAKILFDFERAGFRNSKIVKWSWRYWVPLLGFMQHLVFWKGTLNKREFPFLVVEAAYLPAAAFLAGPFGLVAGIFIYLCMVEIINFPHHLGMLQFHGETRFPAHDQYVFARSCVYSRWFSHGVLLNFNLHTEHHLFPSHPWYQLEAIREQLLKLGLPLNTCQGNEWILANRSKPIDEIMMQTFQQSESETRAA